MARPSQPNTTPSTAVASTPAARTVALGWVALAMVAATLTLGYPALGGQFLVTPRSDQYLAGYAFREFAASTLRSTGHFPLWDPYLFGGMPYVGAMHGDIFYPTFLLRLVLPTDMAMTWGLIIHVFLAGLFTYLFLRCWGIGFAGALSGGMAYMMGGNVAGLVSPGHDGKLFLAALLPVTLLLLLRGIRDGKAFAWGLLAIVIGLAALSPHPQVLQYLLLAAGAFALFLAFTNTGSGGLARPIATRRLGLAFGAIVLGGLMSTVQYLPLREYTPFSPRAGGAGWEHAISFSLPREEVFNMYLPQFTGMLQQYWGQNGIHHHSEYIGAAVLVLATLAFGATAIVARRNWNHFWLGTFIVSLLWSLGGHTPFFRLVYAIVPGTQYFRAPSAMLFVVSFSVACLAAVGTERLLAREVRPRRLIIWASAALALALLGTTGVLTDIASTLAMPNRTDGVYANATSLAIGGWRSFCFVALIAGLGIVVARTRQAVPAAYAPWIVAGIVALDLWTVEHHYWGFSPPAATIFAADAAIDSLTKVDQPVRVLTLGQGPNTAYHDPYLLGDALMVHRVRNALGYHGNELGRYQRLYQSEGSFANPNFWSLANIQYFLTDLVELPFPGVTRVAGPVTNAAGTISYLFKLPGEHPLAWVAPVIVKAADEQIAGTVLDPRFDVRRAALFDTSANVTGESPTALPPALAIRPRATRYEPGHITIALDAAAPAGSALVVSENYYPGWTARVDGKPATLERADYTFLGVPLPAGAKEIDLTFESQTVRTGATVTLVALALAVLAALGGAITDRVRSP